MKSKGKDKVVINKEETAESWCFVCKDGGDLRICDYKECLKSYHPHCVDKDASFLESEDYWACAWHTCFNCRRSSYLHCYTCASGVCRRCLPRVDFFKVKGKKGFCNACLKLALLIEGSNDYDSDGKFDEVKNCGVEIHFFQQNTAVVFWQQERVDFTDKETYEGLFMEYYVIIKKEEGFASGDLYAAQSCRKIKKNHQSGSGKEEFDEEDEEDEEEQISDYDGSEYEKKRQRTRREKRSERQESAMQMPLKSNKKEFIGWASRSLIAFLASIGKSTSEKMSQHDVTSVVNEYVRENKLFHPEKKKMITCDARLQSLFKRKIINKYRVNDLLEAHFAENLDESEDEELGYDSEDSNAGISNACKKQRKLDMEKKFQKKEQESTVPQSCFASVVVENVKLVYLKRSLLHELLRQPESFEKKVIGCFVRVKSDPHDYRSRSSHQLMQVEGVNRVSVGDNCTEIILVFSDMPREVNMSVLSDDDFSEEECEDLRQKVLAGQLKRPTVGDLEQKAKILHEDITKHWISKELALLQNLIDRANEKGWRREMFEHLEKKKKLQTPSEQLKLLENVPKVIPDISELDSNSGEITSNIESAKGFPKSMSQCDPSFPSDGWQDSRTSEWKTHHAHAAAPERTRPASERSASGEPQHRHAPNSETEHCNVTCRESSLKFTSEEKHNKVEEQQRPVASQTEVIELLSDDENDSGRKDTSVLETENADDLGSKTWCIQGPNGERDKCSLSVLKRWSEISPYASEFKVWKEDQDAEDAIWLREAIRIAFPKK